MLQFSMLQCFLSRSFALCETLYALSLRILCIFVLWISLFITTVALLLWFGMMRIPLFLWSWIRVYWSVLVKFVFRVFVFREIVMFSLSNSVIVDINTTIELIISSSGIIFGTIAKLNLCWVLLSQFLIIHSLRNCEQLSWFTTSFPVSLWFVEGFRISLTVSPFSTLCLFQSAIKQMLLSGPVEVDYWALGV